MWPFEDISPYCPSPDEATLVDLVNIADTKSRQSARQKHAFGDMINLHSPVVKIAIKTKNIQTMYFGFEFHRINTICHKNNATVFYTKFKGKRNLET